MHQEYVMLIWICCYIVEQVLGLLEINNIEGCVDHLY